jgi:hypothetical protein
MLRNEPVVFDKSTVMKYSADELISRNGKPLNDSLFQIEDADRSRSFLWHYVSRDSKTTIREQTWGIDSINMLNIWYIKRDSAWNPLTFDFYTIYDEF